MEIFLENPDQNLYQIKQKREKRKRKWNNHPFQKKPYLDFPSERGG